MKCPWCLEEDSSVPIEDWFYADYKVSRHVCSRCNQKYNTYAENGRIKFTVPKSVEKF